MRALCDKVNFILGKLLVYFLMVVFPYVLHDKLNDVIYTRFIAFIVVVYGIFALFVLVNAVSFIRSLLCKDKKIQVPGYVIVFVIYILAILVSSFLSPYQDYVYLAKEARYIGLYYMLGLGFLYIIISHSYRFSRLDIIVGLLASIPAHGIAYINFLGFDIFSFFTNITESTSLSFISTFGNIDIYGVYALFCACLGIGLYILSDEKKKYSDWTIKIVIAFSMIGVLVSDSDAAQGGLALLYLVYLLYVLKKGSMPELKRFGIVSAEFALVSLLLFVSAMMFSNTVRNVQSFIMTLILKDWIIAIMMVIFIVVLLLIAINKGYIFKKYRIKYPFVNSIKFNRNMGKTLYKIVLCMIIVSILLFAGLMCYFTANPRNAENGLFNILVLNDDWGNGRGYIWRALLDGFSNYPAINVLFGTGPGTISKILNDFYSGHWNLWNFMLLDNAHCIPIHILVTTGIIGIIAYFLIIIYPVKNAFYAIKEFNSTKTYNPVVVLGLIGIVCMFLQGCLCIFEVISFPYFIVLLGLVNAVTKNE